MLWCFERRQSNMAAWASRFKAVRRHKTILPNGAPQPRDLTPEHIGIIYRNDLAERSTLSSLRALGRKSCR